MDKDEIMRAIERVKWRLLERTYGNAHATLIGLVVAGWVSSRPSRSALESGPTYAHHPQGKGSTHCDALLLQKGRASGVLEVEGLRQKYTLAKMCDFLNAGRSSRLYGLEFGVLVIYPTGPVGRGEARQIPVADMRSLAGCVNERTDKPVVIVSVDKSLPPPAQKRKVEHDRFKHTEYYHSTVHRVRSLWVKHGAPLGNEAVLWAAAVVPPTATPSNTPH